MEEENSDGKRKSAPSIPANYISILHLQERWINERDRKRKEDEEEERRRKKQAQEQQRVEEGLKNAEAGRKREYTDQKRLDRKHWGGISKEKESIDGGEARRAETEETAAITSQRGEDAAAPRDEGLPENTRGRRKRYDSRKKKKNQAVAVEDVVECGSIAPLITEDNAPVKDAIPVSRKKGEKEATGKKSVASREKAATDDATSIETQSEDLSIKRGETKNLKAQTKSRNKRRGLHPQRVAVEDDVVECGTEIYSPVKDGTRVYRKKGEKATGKKNAEKAVTDDATALETQFEDLSIKRGEERGEAKNLKAQTRSSKRNQINQRHDLHPRRVRMPPIGDATLVWVKKEQNERAGDGIGNGV